MESLILSFEVICPVFLLLVLGYMIKTLKLASERTFDEVNKLVFKIFLPVLLFYNIYKTESSDVFDSKLVVFTIIGVLCIFVLGYLLVFRLSEKNSIRGVMLQGFFRSNFAILGVPLVGYITGSGVSGLASLMVAFVVPVFNVLAIFTLERFRGGNVSVKQLLLGIIKNPLIIGCSFGLVFFIFKLKLPYVLDKTVTDISKIATPLSLVVLGAKFTFSSIKGYVREIVITVSSRLVLVPLILLTAAVLLGFRGEALACILITFGSPVAISSYAMAQQMGGDETLAGHLVVISSAFCMLSLFLWIFILNFLGLF